MRYIVIQKRKTAKYVTVATCTNANDAIICAGALFRDTPADTQLWAGSENRYAFNLLVLPASYTGEELRANLADARLDAPKKLKEWKAKQAAQKAARVARGAICRRLAAEFDEATTRALREDATFKKLLLATPVDVPAVIERARILGTDLVAAEADRAARNAARVPDSDPDHI